jgi:hypothetical protein
MPGMAGLGQKRRINDVRDVSGVPPIAPELARRTEPAGGRSELALHHTITTPRTYEPSIMSYLDWRFLSTWRTVSRLRSAS